MTWFRSRQNAKKERNGLGTHQNAKKRNGRRRIKFFEMIRFLLLQNRAGKTRLAKYYVPLDDSEKHSLEYEVHRLIGSRDPKFTNFVEVTAFCICNSTVWSAVLRVALYG
jgi:Clathrin adaptor complex small chain